MTTPSRSTRRRNDASVTLRTSLARVSASFANQMSWRTALLTSCAWLTLVSCATHYHQEPKVVGWPGSQVFKMPTWTFMAETLELTDGRFRYWFSSDAIIPGGPKYPIEGSYTRMGDELVLSSGKIFKVRRINGREVLFWPHAVEEWDRQQIIPGHMLLPAESTDSKPSTKEGFFTKEQIETSERKARELSERSK